MISTSATLTGTVLSNSVSPQLRGKGVVEAELDSNTYVVSVGGEELRVKLEKGELRRGDRVLVTRRGDTVVLKKLPKEAQKDVIQLARIPQVEVGSPREMQKLADVLRHVAGSGSPPDTPEQFSRLEAVIRDLSQRTEGALRIAAGEAAERLRAFVAEGKTENWPLTREALLRLSGALQQYTSAEFATKLPLIGAKPWNSDLLSQLDSFPRATADLLKSVFPGEKLGTSTALNLIRVLKSAHVVSPDRLKELLTTGPEKLLFQKSTEPEGSMKIRQWLSTAVTTTTSLPELVARFPLLRDSGPELAHHLVNTRIPENNMNIDAFSPAATSGEAGPKIPHTFVADAMTTLGLDTEHRFAVLTSDGTAPENFKTQLLQSLLEATTAPPDSAFSAQAMQKTDPTAYTSLLNAVSQWNAVHGDLFEQLQSTDATASHSVPAESSGQQVSARNLQTAFATVDNQIKSVFEALMSNRLSPVEAARVLEKLLTDLIETIERLQSASTKKTEDSSRSTGADHHSIVKNPSSDPLSPPTEKVRSLREEFRHIIAAQTAPSTAGSGVQNLETAISRLESLQLLARPTPTSEGTQQVVTIPIQADGEWKDLTVQLLKRDAKQKGRKANTYSVQVHIAPGFLGGVAAHLEYDQNHDLVVNIACERTSARQWLSRHKQGITEGLRALGFRSVRTAVGSLDRHTSDSEQPRGPLADESSGSGFDVRA